MHIQNFRNLNHFFWRIKSMGHSSLHPSCSPWVVNSYLKRIENKGRGSKGKPLRSSCQNMLLHSRNYLQISKLVKNLKSKKPTAIARINLMVHIYVTLDWSILFRTNKLIKENKNITLFYLLEEWKLHSQFNENFYVNLELNLQTVKLIWFNLSWNFYSILVRQSCHINLYSYCFI